MLTFDTLRVYVFSRLGLKRLRFDHTYLSLYYVDSSGWVETDIHTGNLRGKYLHIIRFYQKDAKVCMDYDNVVCNITSVDGCVIYFEHKDTKYIFNLVNFSLRENYLLSLSIKIFKVYYFPSVQVSGRVVTNQVCRYCNEKCYPGNINIDCMLQFIHTECRQSSLGNPTKSLTLSDYDNQE